MAIAVFFGPELYQPFSIQNSVSIIKKSLSKNKTFTPEFGYNINFENGEWLIIDLHHGSAGYTIAYDSSSNISIISNYSKIYPSYEVWGPICEKEYASMEDFFKQNKELNWEKFN